MAIAESNLITLTYIFLTAAVASYSLRLEGRVETLGRWATWIARVALAALTAALVIRGVEAGHVPFVGPYEFSLLFMWGILAVYLWMERGFGTQAAGLFILPIAFAIGTYAVAVIPDAAKTSQPLSPALQSPWLQIHVSASAVAYGAFAVAAGLGVMLLASEVLPGLAGRVPSSAQIDRFMWRAVALGFFLLSSVQLTGAIWAQYAWGSYWNWDPKEIWALLTWTLYLVYFHGRALRGWRGHRLAVLAIVGFGLVVFGFYGLGQLVRLVGLESMHVY